MWRGIQFCTTVQKFFLERYLFSSQSVQNFQNWLTILSLWFDFFVRRITVMSGSAEKFCGVKLNSVPQWRKIREVNYIFVSKCRNFWDMNYNFVSQGRNFCEVNYSFVRLCWKTCGEVHKFVSQYRKMCEVKYNFVRLCQKICGKNLNVTSQGQKICELIRFLSHSAQSFENWITFLSHSIETFVSWITICPTVPKYFRQNA